MYSLFNDNKKLDIIRVLSKRDGLLKLQSTYE